MLLTIKKIIKYFIYRWKFREKHVEFDMSCNLSFEECSCEGSNVFHSNVCFRGRIGYASYIGTNSELNAVIGRYCSIASNVKCIVGKHPTKYFVSTHPSFFSIKKQSGFTYVECSLYDENPVIDDQGHLIEIGNDVWIGANVLLLPKIRIGDGAIVAAGSVVTNDVAPYTIVAGVPAKIIKKRFEDDEIEFLLGLKWWNQSEEWIVSHSKYFSDIKQFIIKCKLEGLQ